MDYFDHIEEYCEGQMSPGLKLEFEREMTNNQELRVAVENYESAKLLSESLLEIDLMDQIKRLEKNEQLEKTDEKGVTKTKTRSLYRALAMAASFVGLLGLFYFSLKNQYSNKTLYEKYNFPVKIEEQRSENKDSLIIQINTLYRSNRWESILSLEIENDSTNHDYLTFFKALSYKELGQLTSAKKRFTAISNSDKNLFQEQADWQQVLINLKLEDNKELQNILSKIKRTNTHIYFNAANQLDKSLKSFWRKI